MRTSLLILIAIVLTSCIKKQEVNTSTEELSKSDSLVLKIAVMPVISCLPIYYASTTGIADSTTSIKLLIYNSQMDVDTAITKGHADIAITDLIRAIRLAKDSTCISIIKGVREPISLVALKTKRVKKLNQMKERMVAISRLSITDYWCDMMLDSTILDDNQIYRPQINNVKLRAEMLRTGLIDAAMMSEPYATWMTMLGHKRLFQTEKENGALLAVWIAKNNTKNSKLKEERIEKFINIYRKATEQINKGENIYAVRHILKEEYNIPHEIVDSLRMPPIDTLFTIKEDNVNTAIQWLIKRNSLPKGFDKEFIIEQ